MKAMCIEEKILNEKFGGIRFKVGDTATVLEYIPFIDNGFYRFVEDGGKYRYASERFILLSDIDEEQLLQERIEKVVINNLIESV